RRTSACTACPSIRRNSIRRNICGMRFARRNFRTGCFQTWPGWCEPWKRACHGWLRIETGCEASVHGLGLLVSTCTRTRIRASTGHGWTRISRLVRQDGVEAMVMADPVNLDLHLISDLVAQQGLGDR